MRISDWSSDVCASDLRSRRGGEVGLAHQRLADQEAVDAVGRERIEIGAGRQTAFADKGGVFGCTRRKFDRSVKIDVERLEVTVVYADQARLELERAIELVAVVDLDQHVHAALDRGGFDLGHPAVVERGDDEPDRGGADRAGFERLPRIRAGRGAVAGERG